MVDVLTKTTLNTASWYQQLKGHVCLVVTLLAAAQLLDNINTSAVVVNLSDIEKGVGYKFGQLQWILSAYHVGFVGFLPIGGRLGDLYGHRNILLCGILFTSIWSFINGFARHPAFMSIGRSLQGIGVGLLVPNAMAMVTTRFPHSHARFNALSKLGGSGTSSSIVGSLLGGAVGTTIGWQWVFYLVAIYGALVSVLAFFFLPDIGDRNNSSHHDRQIDICGLITFVAGISLLIFSIGMGPTEGWDTPHIVIALVVGLVLLLTFLVIELHISYPIVPPRIWKSRRFAVSATAALCANGTSNVFTYFLAWFLQDILGYSSLSTALAFIVYGVGMLVCVVLTITLLKRHVRSKNLILIGYVLLLISSILCTRLDEHISYWRIPFPALLIHAIGLAPVWTCTQINAVAEACNEDQGIVASSYQVALQFGNPLGIAIAFIAVDKVLSNDATSMSIPAFHAAFRAGAIIAGIGFLVTLIFAPKQDVDALPMLIPPVPLQDQTMDDECGHGGNGVREEEKEAQGEIQLAAMEDTNVDPSQAQELQAERRGVELTSVSSVPEADSHGKLK